MTTGGNMPGTLAEATKTSRNRVLAFEPPFLAIEPRSHTTGSPVATSVVATSSKRPLSAVAREADSGRLLLVATTDVATGEPVVWDLGSIAKNGGSNARTLFRDVLVAS